ncbi:N-6 DNA methylase [Streptomyces sp. N35]|uniref:N-6 DNA methylase n=1 Tax=Streptomyces sp. N35 TaxID=2795730 RepID=UPI0018F5B151|nr:N-6 DNA methylase [Streptomyces sp. N35]
MAVNAVAIARGMPTPWPVDLPDDQVQRITKRLLDLGDLAKWQAAELGSLREALLDGATRDAAGAWYTPPEIAKSLTRAALSEITDLNLDDDVADVLALSVLDPACGAGVFLIEAARLLAHAYAALLYGTQQPAPLTVRTVMADVMAACIYGIDTDPIAVELAKSVCWLETSGQVPITWLDVNIVVGNALDGDVPSGLARRLGDAGPLAIVGNPPYRDKAKGSAPWIEARRPGPRGDRLTDELWRPSLDEFRQPGQGRSEYVLSNLYVFFWRWALWRAFETRLHTGVVAFLTPRAWITAPAFGGMRAFMRIVADRGLVIDLSPEGKAPPTATRIFPGVTLPLCAALFTRWDGPHPDIPATVQCAKVKGSRQDKFRQVEELLFSRSDDTADSAVTEEQR